MEHTYDHNPNLPPRVKEIPNSNPQPEVGDANIDIDNGINTVRNLTMALLGVPESHHVFPLLHPLR